MTKPTLEQLQAITRRLADEGRIVEAGWVGYRYLVLPENASSVQVNETRRGFFAGAVHLFESITSMMEPDQEPTEADLRRMDLIAKELERFEEGIVAEAAAAKAARRARRN